MKKSFSSDSFVCAFLLSKGNFIFTELFILLLQMKTNDYTVIEE